MSATSGTELGCGAMADDHLVIQAANALPLPFLVLSGVREDAGDDLEVEWANPAAIGSFGPFADGTRLARDAPLGDMPTIAADAMRSHTSREVVTVDRTVVRADQVRHLRFTFAPMGTRTSMTVQDIASEMAARADLEVAQRTLARVESWGNLGVWEVDLTSGSVYASTQVYQILGVEVLTLDLFRSVVHRDDQPKLDHVTRRLVDQPGPYRVTHRIIRDDGTRTVDQHMQSVAGADGRPARILGTVIDVTASHAMEQQLEQLHNEGTVSLLAAGLAHDFNNLLTVVRGHAQVLLGNACEPQVVESLQAIVRAGEQGSDLTRRLMALGRRDEMQPTTVDLFHLLDEIIEVVGPTVAPDVTLVVDHAALPAETRATADPQRLARVVIDLVLNARDAGATTVRLRTRREPESPDHRPPAPGRVVIDLIDNGHGMDDAVVARAFEPFFTTKPDTAGSGLGLANAMSFAAQSLGDLQVSSEVGVGTTFSLSLPIAPDHDRPRRRPRTRIVIATVDDAGAAEIAETVAALGHQTVIVDDLVATMFCLDTEPIDAVVIDPSLPGVSAWLCTEPAVTIVPVGNPVDHDRLRDRLAAAVPVD